MATVNAPRLMTAEEYAQLDEVLGFRDELIEGERVLSPNAVLPHAAVIKQLERILDAQLAELSAEPLQVVRETGWRFRDPASGIDSVPGPDLMVIREEDARRAIKNHRWFEGVPLLVIEVISPSERRARRLQKVGLYLDRGVPNVIEVDYIKRLVLVHAADLDSVTVYRSDDHLTAPFRAAVEEIFAVLES
ncbi:MAG: Uma2 family endonuclease [Bryobacteraceae bacterium]